MGRHLIHSQILDLRYSDEGRAKAAMNQWGDRFQKVWMPVMEEVLDELEAGGKWIRLDRVELDLERIRENLSPEIFREKLKEAFKTQLLKQISEVPIFPRNEEKPKSLLPQDERKPLELLDFLLRQGHKPWWASHSKKDGIRNLVMKLLAEKPKELSIWLVSETFTPTMLFRLHNHVSQVEIQKLISLAFSDGQKKRPALEKSLILALCPEIYQKNELEKKLEMGFLEAFLLNETYLTDPVSKWLKVNLIQPSTSYVSLETYSELLARLIPEVFKANSKKPVLEKVWQKWTETSTFKKSILNPEPRTRSGLLAKTKFQESLKTGNSESQFSKPEIDRPRKQSFFREKLDLDETILISNSGLVLTAPFLPFLFKGLGLIENKQFVSPESQNRAVLLLQALVDDSFSYEESDLLLNKILCGLEPSEPIEVSFSPTETEKEEIKNLLEAMVSQWTALKSTSGESMAKGFFPREGSLKRVSKGYQLTVPRISVDILLNRLPWAISIIKLPWMNETLFTEW